MLRDIETLGPLHCTMMRIAAAIDVNSPITWEEVQYLGRKVSLVQASALSFLLASYLHRSSQVA